MRKETQIYVSEDGKREADYPKGGEADGWEFLKTSSERMLGLNEALANLRRFFRYDVESTHIRWVDEKPHPEATHAIFIRKEILTQIKTRVFVFA